VLLEFLDGVHHQIVELLAAGAVQWHLDRGEVAPDSAAAAITAAWRPGRSPSTVAPFDSHGFTLRSGRLVDGAAEARRHGHATRRRKPGPGFAGR
jgi:hypothetical protein